MKMALAALATIGIVAGSGDANPVRVQTDELLGLWKLVGMEDDGKPTEKFAPTTMTVTPEEITLEWSSGGETRKRIYTYKTDTKANPKRIDFSGEANGRKVAIPGIYKVEKGRLTIVWNLMGRRRPKEFATRDGDDFRLLIYEQDPNARR